MALAVGAECRVAGVKRNEVSVVAVFTLALKDAVIFSVAIMDVPAALGTGVECYKGKYPALVVKPFGSFDYALKIGFSAASEQTFNGFAFVFFIPDHQSFLLPPTIIRNLMSCASDTASAAT